MHELSMEENTIIAECFTLYLQGVTPAADWGGGCGDWCWCTSCTGWRKRGLRLWKATRC